MSLFRSAAWAMQTVTVIKPTMVDDRGTPRPDYDQPAQRFDVSCRVQPRGAEEALDGRTSNIIRWYVFAPADTDLTHLDAVEYLGVRYAVDGDPMRWFSPTGRVDYIRASLIDWQG